VSAGGPLRCLTVAMAPGTLAVDWLDAARFTRKSVAMKTRFLRLSAFLFLLAVAWNALPLAKADKDSPTKPTQKLSAGIAADQILEWLPSDTETVIVSRGPFQVHIPDREAGANGPQLVPVLEILPATFLTTRKGALMKPLIGQTIALAVEGSKRFRSPRQLGMMPFDGCQFIVFQNKLGSAGDEFIAILRKAGKVEQIEGHEVVAIDEKIEEDVWHLLFARPRPDLLLCATDRGYLIEVFRRMQRKAAISAFPASLPEWKQVDTQARFWAIRHFRAGNVNDVTSPFQGGTGGPNPLDRQAVGLTFSYDPNQGTVARIRYLSGNKDALPLTREAWNLPRMNLASKPPEVRQLGPDVVEILLQTKGKDASGFLFALMTALGHAVFV
jgi:hypothetical protein